MGVNCYVSIDGDGIGQKIGRASLRDDVPEVKRLSQAIDAGQRIWISWALSTGGSVVSAGGDEVRLEVPIERLGELPALREDYGRCVGATASVGVGMTLGEADKALLSAKMHGKDQIRFWTEKVDEEVEKLSHAPKTEVEKITDEYLSGAVAKAEPSASMSSPALVGGAGGMAGQAGPGAPAAPDAGAVEAPSASAGVAPEASTTHAADDFEEQFHALAGTQGQKDAATAQQQQGQAEQGQRQDALRQKVITVLKAVQKQAPVLEQVKAQAPQVYKVVMACVQTLIMAARELRGEPPEQLQQEDGDGKGDENVSAEDVKKAELKPPPNATTPVPKSHHVIQPVGATVDNKIKVRHGDGKSGWVQVSSGQILSMDGHAISSLDPGGR